jgi:hypothetical protein
MDSRMLTFSLTPAEFAQRRQELIEQQHIEMPKGNSGEVTSSGVIVSYEYDGSSTLTVKILYKPMLIPESAVVSRIREWFAEPVLSEGSD